MKTAIVCIAYNRVKSLDRLLKSLLKAEYSANNVDIIISIDKSDTTEVEIYADKFTWPYGEKLVRKHTENLGLRRHILSQGEAFDTYDALIILEDDVIVSPAFFIYAKQTLEKYYDNPDIAGISLYSFPLNNYTSQPFEPYKDDQDVFFMNLAQSWGQIWMKKQWLSFYSWYLKNQEFTPSDLVPRVLFDWNKSWLKYHIRYCIECKKFFVYPYFSFSSNCGDAGTHTYKGYDIFQTSMQMSCKQLRLPSNIKDGVVYNSFFENTALYKVLNLTPEECCLDLNDYSHNPSHKKYWLTPRVLPYKIIKQFGLSRHPIEMNVIENVSGQDIFLYDTSKTEPRNETITKDNLILYHYRINDMINFIHKFGIKQLLRLGWRKIISKLKNR